MSSAGRSQQFSRQRGNVQGLTVVSVAMLLIVLTLCFHCRGSLGNKICRVVTFRGSLYTLSRGQLCQWASRLRGLKKWWHNSGRDTREMRWTPAAEGSAFTTRSVPASWPASTSGKENLKCRRCIWSSSYWIFCIYDGHYFRCQDPCSGTCGSNAQCQVYSAQKKMFHIQIYFCKAQDFGDSPCLKISPRKRI